MPSEFSSDVRESKIRHVLEDFRSDLGKVHARFVAEVIVGMWASGSVRLTEIGRALEEDIALHATRKRLSRNLALKDIEPAIGEYVLERGARRVKSNTLLVLAPSSLRKKYAENMEYLDDSLLENGLGETKGYSLCEILAWELGAQRMTPLAETLWSRNAPGAKTEVEEVLSMLGKVYAATDGRGIVVSNNASLNRLIVPPLTRDPDCRFAVNFGPSQPLFYKGREFSCGELGRLCELPYSDRIQKVHPSGRECSALVSFGFLPVRLPEHPARPLWLVVLQHEGKVKQLILTSESMRKKRSVLQWALETSNGAWRAEATNREIKEQVDFDDVRVLKYQRLRNMAALMLFYSFHFTQWNGSGISDQKVRFSSGDAEHPLPVSIS